MPFPEVSHPSPNCARHPPHERAGVCFHHSVLPFDLALRHLADPASRVSYHVLIAPDGRRLLLVDEDRVAWHAGVSTFRGRENCNAFLLGVAFAGDTYQTPLSPSQIASVLEWVEPRWRRYGWTLADMTDHRQVALGRKDDLNPAEWQRLRQALGERFGIGAEPGPARD